MPKGDSGGPLTAVNEKGAHILVGIVGKKLGRTCNEQCARVSPYNIMSPAKSMLFVVACAAAGAAQAADVTLIWGRCVVRMCERSS